MRFKAIYAYLFMICTGIVLSCGDDNEKPRICFPANLKTYFSDSIVYEYTSSRRLAKFLYYDNFGHLSARDELDYDGNGQIIRLRRIHVLSDDEERTYETYELKYDGAGKPKTLSFWGYNTTFPPIVTTFTHDSQGRLLMGETASNSPSVATYYRYEYDDNGNVLKTFYKGYSDTEELLGRENIAFDSHPRFFSGMKDLQMVNIYVFKHEPSKNNMLKSIVYRDGPNVGFGSPITVSYFITYNANGLVESLSQDYIQVTGFSFSNLNYECR